MSRYLFKLTLNSFDSATMLKEHPKDRPNIYHVLRETCHMRGKEVPIRDVRIIQYI